MISDMTPTFSWTDRLWENRFLSHLLFWLLILTFLYSSYASRFYESMFHFWVNMISVIPSQLMAAYLLVYVQIPRYLYTKKYGRFLLSLCVSAYIILVLSRILNVYVVEVVLERGVEQESLWEILLSPHHLLWRYFPIVYVAPALLAILKLVKDRIQERQQLETLRMEKTTAELNFLKAQIHPHFLFNTLNNLYALTLQKSDEAPEVVLKLSEMLDYMLYQCNGPSVPIGKEVELIQNYIELEQLRYGDRLDLTFRQNIDNRQIAIAPLFLLTFVENAFKHGASGDMGTATIHIVLENKGQQLFFQVFNSKPVVLQVDETNFKQGIGANNIRRQLELTYPNRHQLTIEETKDTYTITLYIDL